MNVVENGKDGYFTTKNWDIRHLQLLIKTLDIYLLQKHTSNKEEMQGRVDTLGGCILLSVKIYDK